MLSIKPAILIEELEYFVRKVFGSEIVGLYEKVLSEALRNEIFEILNVEYLDKRKFDLYTLKFWHRLTDLDIVLKTSEALNRLSKLSNRELRERSILRCQVSLLNIPRV